jgi:F-box/leucine-rich repeat protein 4
MIFFKYYDIFPFTSSVCFFSVYFARTTLFFFLLSKDFSYSGHTTGYGETFRKLFSSCQRLEKVFLAAFRGLTDRDLKELTLCKHLKQLDLLGALSLTSEICYKFLLNCPELEVIDLSFCDNISDSQIEQWRQVYPHVAIKRTM